jgi:serine/threonine protein kinase
VVWRDAVAQCLNDRCKGAVLDLVVRVMEAYERLHGLGVLHGDIHPRNVLVGPRHEVSLIDFGMAVAPGLAGGRRGRGGIDFYQEPELARALLAGASGPAPSAAGEQYALAAMVYLLLTGGYTHDFSLERDEMLRQLLAQPPVAFRQRGAQRLGAVEGGGGAGAGEGSGRPPCLGPRLPAGQSWHMSTPPVPCTGCLRATRNSNAPSPTSRRDSCIFKTSSRGVQRKAAFSWKQNFPPPDAAFRISAKTGTRTDLHGRRLPQRCLYSCAFR